MLGNKGALLIKYREGGGDAGAGVGVSLAGASAAAEAGGFAAPCGGCAGAVSPASSLDLRLRIFWISFGCQIPKPTLTSDPIIILI